MVALVNLGRHGMIDNLSRRKKAARLERREKIQKKLDGLRERLIHTRELEGDFRGPNTIGWIFDENDNPVRV